MAILSDKFYATFSVIKNFKLLDLLLPGEDHREIYEKIKRELDINPDRSDEDIAHVTGYYPKKIAAFREAFSTLLYGNLAKEATAMLDEYFDLSEQKYQHLPEIVSGKETSQKPLAPLPVATASAQPPEPPIHPTAAATVPPPNKPNKTSYETRQQIRVLLRHSFDDKIKRNQDCRLYGIYEIVASDKKTPETTLLGYELIATDLSDKTVQKLVQAFEEINPGKTKYINNQDFKTGLVMVYEFDADGFHKSGTGNIQFLLDVFLHPTVGYPMELEHNVIMNSGVTYKTLDTFDTFKPQKGTELFFYRQDPFNPMQKILDHSYFISQTGGLHYIKDQKIKEISSYTSLPLQKTIDQTPSNYKSR